MRVAIAGMLHESNTFLSIPTTLDRFRESSLLEGAAIAPAWRDAPHEWAGFLEGLEKERIEAAYKADKARCDELSGNGKDVCVTQAKAKERIANADLEARAKGTAKARYDAQVVRAEAEYDVAKEKCDDLAGNQKDVCEKEAKAIEVKAKADAKAAYKS